MCVRPAPFAVPEFTSVTEAINKGAYDNKIEFRKRPGMPLVLKKRAIDLTAEELAALPAIKAEFEAGCIDADANRHNYWAEAERVKTKFRADLERENGTAGKPKADKLWELAWEEGHDAGLGSVVTEYERLVALVD